MGHHLAVRRLIAVVDRHQQRGLEPAAVLIVSLEVDVGRPGGQSLIAMAQHGRVETARLEPDVDDMLVDFQPSRLVARGQATPRGHQPLQPLLVRS